MSSPAICFLDTETSSFENSLFYCLNGTKKDKFVENIEIHTHNVMYKSEIERFSHISDFFLNKLKKHESELLSKKVYIEGYSYGSRGKVYEIGENMGLLKYKLLQNGFSTDTLSPKSVKKFFHGSGNAKKEEMVNTALPQISKVIQSEFKNLYTSPVNDLVDSFAIAKYGLSLFLQK